MSCYYYNKESNQLVKLVSKRDSKVCKAIAMVSPKFSKFWTTYGSIIYYPTSIEPSTIDPTRHKDILLHELEHVAQYDRLGKFLFLFIYLLAPLPIFCSGRWFLERYPYLHDIERGIRTPRQAANMLSNNYGWPWPNKLMKKWFESKLS